MSQGHGDLSMAGAKSQHSLIQLSSSSKRCSWEKCYRPIRSPVTYQPISISCCIQAMQWEIIVCFFTAKGGFVDLTSTSRLKKITNCFVLQKAENESKPSNLNMTSWQDNSKVKGESESKLSNANMISWQNKLVLTQLSCQKHLRHPLA